MSWRRLCVSFGIWPGDLIAQNREIVWALERKKCRQSRMSWVQKVQMEECVLLLFVQNL